MAEHRPAWTTETLIAPHRAVDKSARIRRMFNGIAPRYELINAVFSAGRDARWRRWAVEQAQVHRGDVVLDVACGTGDFARAFAAANPALVVGSDFAHEMIKRACGHRNRPPRTEASDQRSRVGDARTSTRIVWCEADALCLPFPSGAFSIVSCAFGVRNLSDLDRGLAEMYRVLAPGGRAVILEFGTPKNRLAKAAYGFYAQRIMPLAATWLSGDRNGAYRYLPRSVVSFVDAEQLCSRLRGAGFDRITVTPLTLGIVTVLVAWRS